MDINNQKFIYFNSPWGTSTRIIANLKDLGLDNSKKIEMTYLKNFIKDVFEDKIVKKYADCEVIYLDGFYDFELEGQIINGKPYESETVIKKTVNAFIQLVGSGKQIVGASHMNFKDFKYLPEDLKKQFVVHDLKYNIENIKKI